VRRMVSRVTAFLRQPFRPLAAVGVLALAPKCVLCLAAYAGLGALLGIRSREICGAAGPGFPWREALAGAALAVGVLGSVVKRRPGTERRDPPARFVRRQGGTAVRPERRDPVSVI
jgi:hypothetical protein